MSECRCVLVHRPAAVIIHTHHAVPLSWQGPDTPENTVRVCIQTHMSTHRLIDAYVRAGGPPEANVLRQYGRTARALAARAWESRPAHPTITSAEAP